MKFYQPLPEKVEYKGKTYAVDFSFSTVLAVLDVLEDEEMTADQRAGAALDLLIRQKHPSERELLEAALRLITPKKKRTANGPPSMDFSQDWEYIYAGFRQAYGIDLFRENLHWLEFTALVKSLPKGTRMREIIEIRTMPVPKPTKHNAEQIAAILRAKTEHALAARPANLQKGLQKLYETLKSQAIGR